MKLAVVVGHCFDAPGAKAGAPLFDSEYNYNLDIAHKIKSDGQAEGIIVQVFLRNGLGIVKCYEQVEAWGPTATVELHFNSSLSEEAYGTETLCGDDAESFKFASFIQSHLCTAFNRYGEGDRGVKRLKKVQGERGWYNVNSIDGVPQCLIEPFFGSNYDDAFMGKTKKVELAQAIVDGFIHWFQGGKAGNV